MSLRHKLLLPFMAMLFLISNLLSHQAVAQSSSHDHHLLLVALGDLFFGGASQSYAINNPEYIFADVLPILRSSDIVIGNLEAPLSLKGSVWLEKAWVLQSDPRSVRALKAGGFSAVSVANNHMMDYGPVALEETLRVLDSHGIAYAGAGINSNKAHQPAVLSRKGVRFAILAYNNTFPLEFRATPTRAGTAYGDPEFIRRDILKARQLADIVIVNFHWSEELRSSPKEYQSKFAHLCIDNGAQIVIGHHPHVLQGLEIYKNGLIAYSLGNFAFGTYSTKVQDSIILQVELDQNGLYRAILYPLNINNHEVACQPRLRHGVDGIRIMTDLQHYSADWGSTIDIQPDGTGIINIKS